MALIFATISCSLLGVFVVWQRISYFGDALSHAVLFGLALGALLEINPILAVTFFSAIFAILIFLSGENRYLGKDANVMIISYLSIALAIICNDLWIKNLDFSSYIFGDVLAVGIAEILILSTITVITILYVIFGTKKIMLINLNADLAKISGIKNRYWEVSFLILLAVTIAVTTHVIGIFLTTALLILPAAISRMFSKSAKEMILISVAIGSICACISFGVATHFNLTIGPVIIAIFCAIFFLTKAARSLR